jgi:hypothetical protein
MEADGLLQDSKEFAIGPHSEPGDYPHNIFF